MLTEICQELHNWFERDRRFGTFTIEDGHITADFLKPGQYYRIIGSIFSDGVHRYPDEELPDETFEGAVWALAIPLPVVRLAKEIEEWRGKYEAADSAAMSPFTSESFGGYSYSKGGGSASSAESGGSVSWRTAFAKRLNAWRKIR